MKRSGIERKAPMQRASSLRKPAAEPKPPKGPKQKGLKRNRPRMTPIRKSAMGQACTLCLPGVCNHNPETTVLCHSNYLADGKGMGMKAPDTVAAYGCSACHDVLDGRAPRPDGFTKLDLEAAFYAAVILTHVKLRAKGLL